MTHIAVQENLDGKVVDWIEKVSDEQYKELLTLIRRTFGAINGLVADLESADAARAYDELRKRRRNRPRRRGGLDGQTPEQ